jgi:hypothetical protein
MMVQREENLQTHSLAVMAHPAAFSLTRSVTAAIVDELEDTRREAKIRKATLEASITSTEEPLHKANAKHAEMVDRQL